MIDGIALVSAMIEKLHFAKSGEAKAMWSDMKEREGILESLITRNLVSDKKSYMVGQVIGDIASTIKGVFDIVQGVPKILAGMSAIAMGSGLVETVIGPVPFYVAGTVAAAAGVAQTGYGVDVICHSMSKLKDDVLAFSKTKNVVGTSKTGKYDFFKNFDEHYDIHVRGDKTKRPNAKREYGDDYSKDDYYKDAFDLATSKADMKDIFSRSLSAGREAIYRKSTNDLVIIQNGEVTTFYKPKFGSPIPDAGYNYFKNLK